MSSGRAIWIVWLLCVSITAASLDSVPDPPAIKQRTVQSQSLDFAEQLEHAVCDARQGQTDLADVQCASFWPAFPKVPRPVCALGDSPLMRQAADPSPPIPIR